MTKGFYVTLKDGPRTAWLASPYTDHEKAKACVQTWLRIRLSLAAYAYEYRNESIMSDPEYDQMSKLVDTSIATGNDKLDDFFREHFTPDSGMWNAKHPELDKLAARYDRFYGNKKGAKV